MKTTKSRSANLAKAAPLSAIYTEPTKDVRPAQPRALPPSTTESAEGRFVEMLDGLDPQTEEHVRAFAQAYAHICVLEHLSGYADTLTDEDVAETLRQVLRAVYGTRTEVEAKEVLRESLRVMAGFEARWGELHYVFVACQEYARVQARETVLVVYHRLQPLRGTISGMALLYATGLETNESLRAAAKRLGTSAANLSQQAKRTRSRLPWWKLNPLQS